MEKSFDDQETKTVSFNNKFLPYFYLGSNIVLSTYYFI